MAALIFPTYEARMVKRNGKPYIFDIIRKKYIFLTPEEWIRQHCINFLIHHKNYPKALLSVERGHKINSRLKRSDLIVYNSEGRPFMLIEFKSAETKIGQAVLEQISTYNQSINAKFMVVTNGIDLLCAEIMEKDVRYSTEIPDYSGF